MSSQKEPRVSYIIPNASDSAERRHTFCVNSLIVDTIGKYLFTAGRDGTIKAWNEMGSCVSSMDEHTDWVNDIVVTQNNKTLVSCSNDSTVRLWNVEDMQDESITNRMLHSVKAHRDYVKALAYSPIKNTVISAGFDHTLRVWDLETLLKPVSSVNVEGNNLGNEKSDTNRSQQASLKKYIPPTLLGSKESIYSLCVNKPGNMVASGSTEKVVRFWDLRSGEKLFKLRGHKDNIKCILLNDEGTWCVSGSADKTIKLWDLRQQRCVHTFACHSDSVWTLTSDINNPQHIISGGRDGMVNFTDITTNQSCTLIQTQQPILKASLTPDGSHIWTSTLDASIAKYEFRSKVESALQNKKMRVVNSLYHLKHSANSLSSSSLISDANSHENHEQSQGIAQPVQKIASHPGIVQHAILNTRRHVLARDEAGHVSLWDVTLGKKVEDFGNVDFDNKIKEINEEIYIPNWFTIDSKLGCITVNLDFPQCLNAEVFATDCGFETSDEETRVNIGECVVKSLFAVWRQKRQEISSRQNQQKREGEESNSSDNEDANNTKDEESSEKNTKANDKPNGAKDASSEAGAKKEKEKQAEPESNGNKLGNDGQNDQQADQQSFGYTVAPTTKIIIDLTRSLLDVTTSTNNDSPNIIEGPIQKYIEDLDGYEELPRWIVRVLVYGASHPQIASLLQNPTNKVSFYLVSTNDASLPNLSSQASKLSANKILRMRRVFAYVIQRLELELPYRDEWEKAKLAAESGQSADNGQHGSNSEPPNTDLKKSASASTFKKMFTFNKAKKEEEKKDNNGTNTDERQRITPEEYLELSCNNKMINPLTTLGTVNAYMRGNASIITIHYRKRHPNLNF